MMHPCSHRTQSPLQRCPCLRRLYVTSVGSFAALMLTVNVVEPALAMETRRVRSDRCLNLGLHMYVRYGTVKRWHTFGIWPAFVWLCCAELCCGVPLLCAVLFVAPWRSWPFVNVPSVSVCTAKQLHKLSTNSCRTRWSCCSSRFWSTRAWTGARP